MLPRLSQLVSQNHFKEFQQRVNKSLNIILTVSIPLAIFAIFFARVADSYVDDWKKVVPFSNSVPHILLLRLFEPYNKECYEELKRICPFHKLAYKRTSEEVALKGTFYDP